MARQRTRAQTAPVPLAPAVPGLGGFSAGVNFYKNGTTTGGNYKPRVSIGDGASEGSAALESDHTAIGATLRIWAGDSPR